AVVKNHRQNVVGADEGDVQVILLPLVEVHRELFFTEQFRKAAGSRCGPRGETRKARYVDLGDFANSHDDLPVGVEQEDRFGQRLTRQFLARLFETSLLFFINDDARIHPDTGRFVSVAA
ncbi:MAG: hypothetical protein ACJA1R_001835, partial [Flavobacteriales bacterium]